MRECDKLTEGRRIMGELRQQLNSDADLENLSAAEKAVMEKDDERLKATQTLEAELQRMSSQLCPAMEPCYDLLDCVGSWRSLDQRTASKENTPNVTASKTDDHGRARLGHGL